MRGETRTAGSLQRALRTPLLDLARRRTVDGRELSDAIAAVNLPPPVADVVAKVTRATRLWPAEQLDVARELVTHFQDALEEVTDAARETGLEVPPEDGARVAKLVADFGDPVTTARLIRRARLRSRPLPARLARAAKQALVGFAAFFLLVYGALFLRFHSEDSSLPPAVVPGFVEEHNAAVERLAEDEKAWPIYDRAYAQLRAARDAWPLHPTADPDDSPWRLFLARPGDAAWPHLAAFLENAEVRDGLREARSAGAAPHLGFRLRVRRNERGDVRIDSREVVKGLSFLQLLLVADVAYAQEKADGALAHASLVALTALARQVREPAPFHHYIYICAPLNVRSIAVALTDVLVRSPELLSEKHLVDLAHRLAGLGGPESFRFRWETEREAAHLRWDRLYCRGGKTRGRISRSALESHGRPGSWWGGGWGGGSRSHWPAETVLSSAAGVPVLPFLVVTREALEEKARSIYAAVDAQFARPLWERDVAFNGPEFRDLRSVRYLPFRMWRLPLPSPEDGAYELMLRDAALVSIALELFRRRHEGWPERLEELVPAFLPALPLDQFDGQPLRYRLVDGKPLLYSIGEDRDDDGGRRHTDRKRGGDWILREP